MKGKSFSNGNGNGEAMGESASGQGPASRNPYLGDERLNEGKHWWYWA